MPRTIYSPTTGVDVSASVQNTLMTSRSIMLARLYSFSNVVFWDYNPTGNYAYWSFTDADFPVAVNYLQLAAVGAINPVNLAPPGRLLYNQCQTNTFVTYQPRYGSNDGGFKCGPITYEVGLAAHDVDVTWFLDDEADYFGAGYLDHAYHTPLTNPPVNILPMKQAMAYYHAFDDCPFWIHLAIFSTNTAPPTLLGTNLLWRGYIRHAEAAADYLTISLGSLMQIVQDTQVPGQSVISTGFRGAPYMPFGGGVQYGVLGGYGAGNTPNRISAVTYQFTASMAITEDQLQDSWIIFYPGSSYLSYAPVNGLPPLGTPGWRIQGNTATAGGSGASTDVTFYDPPIIPGDCVGVNLLSPTSSGPGKPFPYLPQPETSI